MPPAVLSLMRTITGKPGSLDSSSLEEAELNWMIASGMGPLFRHFAFDQLEHLPATSAESLLRAELQAKINAKLRQRAMTGIIDACEGKLEGSFTLLKGISICEQHYPEPHLRPMADIDFLVSREDVPAVEGTLVELGYEQLSNQPASFYETHHHTMPFTHPQTGVCVEVHTELLPPIWELSHTEAFSLTNTRRESVPSTFAARQVFRLSNELQLLLISSDIGWERWILGRPIPLFDVLFLLQGAGSSFDWDRLVTWMDHPGLSVRVSLLLAYLERRQVIRLPPEASRAVRRGARQIGRLHLRILHKDLERHSMQGLSLKDRIGLDNRRIIWETLTSPGSHWLRLLRVPWNLLFPPGHSDELAFKVALRRLQAALRRSGGGKRQDRR